jgi:hypothetical protein
MQLELRGWDIHALSTGRTEAAGRDQRSRECLENAGASGVAAFTAEQRGQLALRARRLARAIAPVWDKLRDEGLAGMTMLGRHLLETGQLREEISLDEVRDVL